MKTPDLNEQAIRPSEPHYPPNNQSAHIVLLPGLDGTGTLFADFLEKIDGPRTVISYPPEELLGYREIQSLVTKNLPEAPFVLLGESFSGPIAVAIAAMNPPNLRGIILCASFVRSPLRLPMLTPLTRFLPARPPISLLCALLMGRRSTPNLRKALFAALDQVHPSVLQYRLREALFVDYRSLLCTISVPALYLRATGDRVIPARCMHEFLDGISDATSVDIDGPHFLLQCQPAETARAVEGFLQRPGPPASDQPNNANCRSSPGRRN